MIQIRRNAFETNSSSTHSICITKNTYDYNSICDNKITVTLDYFGREEKILNTPDEKLSYLCSALYAMRRYRGYKGNIDKNYIYNAMAEIGVECVFTPLDEDDYCIVGVDNPNDVYPIVLNICKNKKKLYRFLFTHESFIIMGSDELGTDTTINVNYPHETFYIN